MLSIPGVSHATSRCPEALAADACMAHRDGTVVFPRSQEGHHYAMDQSLPLHFEIVLSC